MRGKVVRLGADLKIVGLIPNTHLRVSTREPELATGISLDERL